MRWEEQTPTLPPRVEALRNGIIVSCQASPESPLHGPRFMAAMAQAAEMGGAVGFRVNGPDDVSAVRAVTARPIIGIHKRPQPGFEVYITPDFGSAAAVVRAGADIVAVDATQRPRPGAERLEDLIRRIHEELGVMVMADIATVEEGVRAVDAGADLVATTLVGFTPYTRDEPKPAVHVVRALAGRVKAPVIAEGGIWTVEDVRAVFDAGAFAAVIGSAITAPQLITQRFVGAVPNRP
ncbi:N-acetylmannosamine-6-phosphate 2-epimerase [Carboxydichorda subterranea]|uniref:N-acetylmannosamine-6-phosphate 2-epimerase n=1 Tax=Carboxydichorda subterranea TaxID=3109565 RepID=UPI003857DAC3